MTRFSLHFLLCGVALTGLSVTPAVFAQCPQSTVSCDGRNASYEVVFLVSETSDAPANAVSWGKSAASYDLVDGTLRAVSWVEEAWWHTSRAIAVDRFELHGVPAASITIRLVLSSNGVTDPAFRTAWVAGSARLAAGGQTAVAQTPYTWFDVPHVEISAYMIEGEPLEVTYEVAAEGWGYYPSLTVNGQLGFIGLPDGGRIMSCNGFDSSPLAVETRTWGAVKALYR
jgi:hypothetical protein